MARGRELVVPPLVRVYCNVWMTFHDACHVTKSPRLSLCFPWAGQRSYVELLRERRESLGARLLGSCINFV